MKRILLVEDELEIAELERDYLEINEMEVTIERNGARGLELALQDEFDLIILDIMLPDMSGFDICREIRAKKEVPILLVSARKEDIDKIRGLGLGADDYITKPFSPSELVARVKAHLARYERLAKNNIASQNEILQVHDLTLDLDGRKVFVADQEIIFTTKEFDLLVFLAKRPNRVWNKEQLFEQIWGMQAAGDVSTVVVHIRKIREKLESHGDFSESIETIWGAGYRFNL
ncbi:response regulator transcription factor [Listeria booriae]|uniref:Response regulator transcription factor n=1 Tax=Listeria booriae TaxID=1552123 RepID=A0A7X0ZMR2_9LIST|nr:response regulator transcription factor [Listeria booriae]MBC1493383.1 response regulator transcription factor [Listeria booriae]MBC1505007.1 response regulator transcription factor [Listeria booriae]MBC1560847.1 response regulator transcription factor [Listeria booriae]MBC1573784.1 response regulator transcription factor [Listeria booriae]MBC1778090.1 response regulator transcription factor [Listeria booriae]